MYARQLNQKMKQFNGGHAQFRYRHLISAYFVPSVPSELGY